MIKSGVSLLLLWSLCSTGGIGPSSATTPDLNTPNLNGREPNTNRAEEGSGASLKWLMAERRENIGEAGNPPYKRQRRTKAMDPVLLTTPAPIPWDTPILKKHRLQARQDDDDDDRPPPPPPGAPPPGPPPGPPPPCLPGVSNDIAISVSFSVARDVSSQFQASLATVMVSASSAIEAAQKSGFAAGLASATATNGASATAEPTTTGDPGTIADLQASYSRAIEEAQAVASSSAQAAVEAASASASAAMAACGGSSLTPGQIGGIVISMAAVTSILSALATFFFMRRNAKKQEFKSKYDPDSPPDSRHENLIAPSGLAPKEVTSSGQVFGAAVTTKGHQRAATLGANFAPDMKQRPPDSQHPAMSYSVRPLSDGGNPIFPVSPLSTVKEQSLANRDSSLFENRHMPFPDVDDPSWSEMPTVQLSLARKPSRTGGQRVQLVRVGSERSARERSESLSSPLALNPIYTEPMDSTIHTAKDGENISTPPQASSPLQVQAPIPRRPVDYGSLENGTGSRTLV